MFYISQIYINAVKLNDVSGAFSSVFSIEENLFPFNLHCMYAFQDCHSELAPGISSFIYVKNAHFQKLYLFLYAIHVW